MTENLATLIQNRGPIRTIGVIGMGYVGIPAAALFADVAGVEHVYGFQRDSASSGYKIAMLNRGESPLKGEEPGLEELLEKVVGAEVLLHRRFLEDRRVRRGDPRDPDPVQGQEGPSP